jgi:hypothetical protein
MSVLCKYASFDGTCEDNNATNWAKNTSHSQNFKFCE